MYALRHCLRSYVLNFDNDEEATEEKCDTIFWCVKVRKIGLRKRRGFMPRPKHVQNVNAARLAFQYFSVND